MCQRVEHDFESYPSANAMVMLSHRVMDLVMGSGRRLRKPFMSFPFNATTRTGEGPVGGSPDASAGPLVVVGPKAAVAPPVPSSSGAPSQPPLPGLNLLGVSAGTLWADVEVFETNETPSDTANP